MHRFHPNVGGHAPGHLRGFFLALVDLDSRDAMSHWPDRGLPADRDPLGWIAAKLRNCDDVMPADACVQLHLPRTSTYAAGARAVMRELADPDSPLGSQRGEREEMCALLRYDNAHSFDTSE
jgi:hypothetical protein